MPVVKPNGGSSPDQGIGTRQPSRPRIRCPELSQTGSCDVLVGQVLDLPQAELLALVEEDRAGQGEE